MSKVQKHKAHKSQQTKEPLWNGPELDGITQSLLQKFIVCRERFRIKVVEGLTEDYGFNYYIEFGSLFHEALEEYSAVGLDEDKIKSKVKAYSEKLKEKYPTSISDIIKWASYAYETFMIYIKYWSKDEKNKDYLFQEETFKVPYTLPSGRTIFLRGKFDAVFSDKRGGIWLQENKTKGTIDTEGLFQSLHNDLQVMFYLIALERLQEILKTGTSYEINNTDFPKIILKSGKGLRRRKREKNFTCHTLSNDLIQGCLYNVIRRPLGDRSSIRPRKEETDQDFTERIFRTHESRPGSTTIYPVSLNKAAWFKRWSLSISPTDIDRFKKECFDPLLESLCDWWQSINTFAENPFNPWYSLDKTDTWISETSLEISPKENPLHFRRPFGVYDRLSDGMRGDYFDYITKGGKSKLVKTKTLFPELEDS